MTKLPAGFIPLGGSNEDMVRHLAKRAGGIPDFAKDALQKMGIDKKVIDEADKDGRS